MVTPQDKVSWSRHRMRLVTSQDENRAGHVTSDGWSRHRIRLVTSQQKAGHVAQDKPVTY
eukprot:2719593-Rhodomonas_salina.1